ncbi:COMPASS (complex proteins associated with Set1p) component [Malassezia obtusa]|uniref:COMPASS (Complex proteins associated with Set1p) component n=1 Tax=Malassezia obtusa TaxID=76774 RepID=A0AAF0IR27_9BASI|nr:COMPASS (complex proteins associated with Set1p) component [Malassezia obtusa]
MVEVNGSSMEERKRKEGDALREGSKRIDVHGPSDAGELPRVKQYCLCRQAFGTCQAHTEDDRVMIACDHCDEWFHASCLQIADEAVELIDQFVCPYCEQSMCRSDPETQTRTSYKQPCKAEACTNPARLPISSYCSDACGMRAVRERAASVAKTPAQRTRLATDAVRAASNRRGVTVWTRPTLVRDAPKDESASEWLARIRSGIRSVPPISGPPPGTSLGVYVREHATPLNDERERAQFAAELAKLRSQSAQGNTGIDVLAVRGKLLQLAEDRLSALPHAPIDETSKKKETSNPRCGFDARLAWDDEPLWQWATSPEGRAMLQEDTPLDGRYPGQPDGTGPYVVCGEPKRRCKRHTDWSIVRGADTEVARELQTLYVSTLAEREQHLRAVLDTPT